MLLIRGGNVIDPKSNLNALKDIYIENGIILKIADPVSEPSQLPFPENFPGNSTISNDAHYSKKEKALTVLDASGCIVCPGLIDAHSHFRDPGFTWKEDLHTGSLAAAKGGYTSVILMANTNPTVDSPEILTDILTRGKKERIHLYSGANVTMGMEGKELTDMTALAKAGAVVFTDDGKPVLSEELFTKALETARELDIPVSLHEEDPMYIEENGINGWGRVPGTDIISSDSFRCSKELPEYINKGTGSETAIKRTSGVAQKLGIGGSSREAEISMIRRDTEIAVRLHAKLVIQHISTKEGVDIVRKARELNPLIQAEATPHHFSLTEDAVLSKGSLAKVNPPLRTEEDRLAIIEGLRDGTISMIATDHAPHTDEEKAVTPLWKAPSGMIGLETALSLSIQKLVNAGFLTMSQMLAKLTCNPASYYKLQGGTVQEGGPADITIFDPNATWTVSHEFTSKSHNSPFIGEKLPGVVRWTIVGGEIVYSH